MNGERKQNEILKTRFIVQGHVDEMKKSLAHNIIVARQFTSKLTVGLASALGFKVASTNVNQPYLKSAGILRGDVYLESSNDLNLRKYQALMLIKPVYGLSESGSDRERTFINHLREEI